MTTVADLLPLVTPQLAHPGGQPTDELLSDPNLYYDVKWDGIRCLAFVDPGDGTCVLLNRRLRDITFRYPDVVAALLDQIQVPCVLDGEIIAFAGGKPSFALAAQRDSVTKPASVTAKVAKIPAVYAIFDLLHVGDEDIRRLPLRHRLELLNVHVVSTLAYPLIATPGAQGSGQAIWAACVEKGLEGVIAKRLDAPYTGRRTRDWIKYKTTQRVSAVVSSYEPGEGARRNTIGACFLQMVDERGTLVPVGKVGTGFTETTLAQAKEWLDAGQPFIAEIECLSIGTGGVLRHPSFKGFRSDLTLADCTVQQLDKIPRT